MTSWRTARNEPRKITTEHGLMIGRAVLHKAGPSASWDEAEAEAHARLMAAAPDMLEALREAELQIVYLHEKFAGTGSGETALLRIRAAIAAAEGRP